MKRELEVMADLVLLAYRNLGAQWSETVKICDASAWGAGIMGKHVDFDEVRAAGAFNDRWRFGRGAERRLNPRADLEVPAEDGSAAAAVPSMPSAVWGGDWKRVVSQRWDREEPRVILEGRAAERAVRRLPRSSQAYSRRHLLLTDALAVVLALATGPSSSPALLGTCRRVGAVCVAAGLQVSYRWLPSEQNASDVASRGGPSRSAAAWQPAATDREHDLYRACLHGALAWAAGLDATDELVFGNDGVLDEADAWSVANWAEASSCGAADASPARPLAEDRDAAGKSRAQGIAAPCPGCVKVQILGAALAARRRTRAPLEAAYPLMYASWQQALQSDADRLQL